MATERKQEMRQCECGAYRSAYKNIEDKWKWASGCRACDTIERLRVLLDGGVRVIRGSDVTCDPDKLRRRANRAEEEVEKLQGELGRRSKVVQVQGGCDNHLAQQMKRTLTRWEQLLWDEEIVEDLDCEGVLAETRHVLGIGRSWN